MEYLQRVNRIRHLAREYWFELLIAVMAIAGMLELVIGRDSPGAPSLPVWTSVLLVAVLVLPLFARRRFPFAAPAIYWVLAPALTLFDGLLIPFIGSLGVVGLATAFLLGNLRSRVKAGVGLVLIVIGILIVIGNIPGDQTASQFTFITLRFVVAWIAGYALRERAEQAEAAEIRAAQAEREREAAARVAVAEERARIARELHDIVAHAVSVMVLQVGAVRHKLPDSLAEDREALKGVERAGRTALAEMRRLLAAMRPDGDEAQLVPQPGLDGLNSLLADVGRAGLPVELWHANVHQDYRWVIASRLLDRLESVARFRHYLDVVLSGEQHPKARSDHRLIVGDEYPRRHLRSSTMGRRVLRTKPPSGSGRALISPP